MLIPALRLRPRRAGAALRYTVRTARLTDLRLVVLRLAIITILVVSLAFKG